MSLPAIIHNVVVIAPKGMLRVRRFKNELVDLDQKLKHHGDRIKISMWPSLINYDHNRLTLRYTLKNRYGVNVTYYDHVTICPGPNLLFTVRLNYYRGIFSQW